MAYTAITVDHFQHPRNVGRLADADGVGRVDDPTTETTITFYVKVANGQIGRATFRTFGCSACVAASSMASELLVGRPLAGAALASDELDAALGGLPPDKRYCADLVSAAVGLSLAALAAA